MVKIQNKSLKIASARCGFIIAAGNLATNAANYFPANGNSANMN